MQIDEASKAHGFGWMTESALNDFATKYQQWGLVKNKYTFGDFATNELMQQLGK
jgi:hypothetical protein